MSEEKTSGDEIRTRRQAPGRPLVFALIALLALTALSFGLHFAPLGGRLGAIVALAIAGTKVTVVALVFMELRASMVATRVVAVTSVAFVALLCLGIAGDIAFR
jgi:caa(3)-type oxidase subunit IV